MAELFNEVVEKSFLHDWVEQETRQLDLVASWESLCDTYRFLEFVDPINDAVRLEEFKWIIAEMNKHLSRARKQLLSCQDKDATMEVLKNLFSPAGKVSITGRKDLAYHKLRQRWVSQMMAQLEMMELDEEENHG